MKSSGCLMRVVRQFSWPFDHVALLTKINQKTGECECISISLGGSGPLDNGYVSSFCKCLEGGKGVRFGVTTMRISGYSYFRLELSSAKYAKLLALCREISKKPTTFDMLLQFRLKTPQRPLKGQEKWICSQLIGFLLQECGVIPKNINPSRLSPTDIFLILLSPDERTCPGGPCEDPFLGRAIKNETSLTVFGRQGGVRLNPDQRLLLNE